MTFKSFKQSNAVLLNVKKYNQAKEKYKGYLGYQSRNILADLAVKLHSKTAELANMKQLLQAQTRNNEELLTAELDMNNKFAADYMKIKGEIKELLDKNSAIRDERQRNMIAIAKARGESDLAVRNATAEEDIREREYALMVKTLDKVTTLPPKKETKEEEIVANVLSILKKEKVIDLTEVKQEKKQEKKEVTETKEVKETKQVEKEVRETNEKKEVVEVKKTKEVQKESKQVVKVEESQPEKKVTKPVEKKMVEEKYIRPKREFTKKVEKPKEDEFKMSTENVLLTADARATVMAKVTANIELLAKKEKPDKLIYDNNQIVVDLSEINDSLCADINAEMEYDFSVLTLAQHLQLVKYLLHHTPSINLTNIAILEEFMLN